MGGQGEFADLMRHRFALACRRLGLNTQKDAPLDTTRFRQPATSGTPTRRRLARRASDRQLDLF
jgi:hypothetical protein